MASVTEKPRPDSPQPNKPPQRAPRAEEQMIDREIRRTRRALKVVDFVAGMITLAIGVLAYLLTASILEHWVIPGGWSGTARTLLFGTLILGIVWYCWRIFWPMLGQSINPAYAAQAIEQSSPSLKNSLLNLLLLRNRKRHLSRQVYQAIEQQAAQGLSQVSMDSVVDRSVILRLGYILVAIVALCALYRFISPKDLFSSAARVMLPWSNIATPSRVEILNVAPGDTKAARGEQLKITAEILGLEEDEPVRLLYSTADEQIVGQEIPMSVSAGGSEFYCQVPARIGVGKSSGIQQDFTYWIEAGDARSPRYNVKVFARPTMVVNRLRYEYPAYTGYPSRDVEHTGDIRAVEGTKVTLFAQANKPIKSAHIDFEADGRRDLLMNATDQQATVTFPLALREDRRTPRYQSYVLRYLTTAGNQNELPPKYQIDVQPDYSPEIQLLLPEEAMLEVAVNQEVNFELEARDPDFALSKVILIGKVGEEQKVQEELLSQVKTGEGHTGRFVGKLRKTPEQLGLKVGDVLEYWGAAADNRRPEANLAYSAHRKLRVVGKWQGDQGGEQEQEGEGQQQPGEGGDSQEGEGGQEGQAGGGEQGNSSEGEEGQEGEGGQGQQSSEPNENSEQQGQGESASANGQDQGEDGGPDGNAQGNSPSGGSENSESQNDGNDPTENPSDGEGGEGGEQGKVSSEGDDDGTAFEKMAKHFEEQSGEGQSGNESSGDARDAERGEEQAGENEGQAGAEQDRTADGEGPQGEAAAGEDEPQGGEVDPNGESESPDGQMSPEQGEGGEGDSAGEDQGTPNSDGANRPQDKQGDSSDAAEQQGSDPASKSRDKTESDSEGGQGGDRSGGGQEGAGQQAKEEGKGAAGENEAADDGAGQAAEPGDGETGEKPGGNEKAAGETGESSGDQAGEGSEQGEQAGDKPGGTESNQDGANGEQNGEQGTEPSNSQPNESAEQQPNNGQKPADESASAEGKGEAGDPSGTGGQASSPPSDGELQAGDEANLDYARKQTDLILDRLDEQLNKKEVDKSLLDKLGWTQDELRRFVDRWKGLKSKAEDQGGSDESKSELNDALRSLGLGRNTRTGFNSKIDKDKLRDLQDAFRSRVPLEFQEQIRSYVKGTATTRETTPQEK